MFEPLLCLILAGLFGVTGFTILIAMRATLIIRGAMSSSSPKALILPEGLIASASAEIWPNYSILVPLFKEAASVPKLVHSLRSLDYPADKLEVLFLLEAEDKETLASLLRAVLPEHWPIFILPEGQPRTKPRALNVALQHLTGQMVTIYDAEDRPHPLQLKEAVRALRAGGAGMACVQAPLRAYNARSSWISGQWALEYATHFGLLLPALAMAQRPIALSGTSNHFRVAALRAAGGWDAWNVTEDADLGLRLARLGYKVGTIDLPTLEEAPETLRVWIPQRSRWIKGYMQTAGVILREPHRAMLEMGVFSFIACQVLLIGTILSASLKGPVAIVCLLFIVLPDLFLTPGSMALFVAVYAVHIMAAVLAPGAKDLHRFWLVVTAPFYWTLQSLAALRAIWELATQPHLWSKTPHALTQSEIGDQWHANL